MKKVKGISVVTIVLVLFYAGCMQSCNPQKKIQKAERVLKDNNALAGICADEYPVKEVYIKGDSVLTLDTLYVGENVFDTLIVETKDTVFINITKTLPAKVIIKTVKVTDTIVKENTARVSDLTNIVKTKDVKIGILEQSVSDWKAKAKQRFGWLLLIIAAIGAYTFLRIKKIISF